MIVVPSARARQPDTPVLSQQYRDAAMVLVGSQGVRDITGRSLSGTLSWTRSHTQAGPAIRTTATAGYVQGSASVAGLQGATMVVSQISANSGDSGWHQTDSGTPPSSHWPYAGSLYLSTFSYGRWATSVSGSTVGRVENIVVTARSGEHTLYVNGALLASASGTSFGFDAWVFGDNANTWGFVGDTLLFAALPYWVPPHVALALSRNPWQIFAPVRRPVFFAAGGAPAELAGAGVAGATGSGALTTAIPILGAAVVSATGSGALTTAIPLAGAAATVSATGSGNLSTTIRLDGAALASVAGAGALTAQITLSGAALASVVGTGALTTAPAGLAGDATGGATGTGALTTGIALAGSASVSVIGAGGLVTGIPLAGGATASVSGAGDLTITLSGLSGAALASVVGGGALLTSITLSGAALASALGAGVLTTLGVETYGIRGRSRPAQITRAKRRN